MNSVVRIYDRRSENIGAVWNWYLGLPKYMRNCMVSNVRVAYQNYILPSNVLIDWLFGYGVDAAWPKPIEFIVGTLGLKLEYARMCVKQKIKDPLPDLS